MRYHSNPYTTQDTTYQVRVRPLRPTDFGGGRKWQAKLQWCVEALIEEPGGKRRMFVIGGAGTQHDTEKDALIWAKRYARDNAKANPRNYYPTKVFDVYGKCVTAYLDTEEVRCDSVREYNSNPYTSDDQYYPNPYTSNRESWARWEYRILRVGLSSYGYIWEVWCAEKLPGQKHRTFKASLPYNDYDHARSSAFDLAQNRSLENAQNPNSITVYDERGRCLIVYLHGKSIADDNGTGKCVEYHSNPYTSPWNKIQIKVVPGEFYIHDNKRRVTKWHIRMWLKPGPTADSNDPEARFAIVGYGVSQEAAIDGAIRLAKAYRNADPNNPNAIPVFDSNGQKVFVS